MAVRTQHAADYYTWEVPGKPLVIHLHLDIVDCLLAAIQDSLETIPKRGLEVGGLLLGSIEPGQPAIVRIEDFEPVDSAYDPGPADVSTPADRGIFEAALNRRQPDDSRPDYAVGFYRSHTRDGLSLSTSDRELAEKYFQPSENVVLLIKPFRSRPSPAGFFFREEGKFQETTPLEFPFRRSALSKEEISPESPPVDPVANGIKTRLDASGPEDGAVARTSSPPPVFADAVPRPKSRSPLWFALSFLFLLVGLGLGLALGPLQGMRFFREDKPDFSLGLSISRPDENIAIKWDRQSPAIRGALRGTIEIVDGSETLSKSLEAIELRSGSLIYRNTSNAVKIRLIVYTAPRVSVTETADWSH